ncbi:O-antigen ligase family protein [Leptospira ognonensis]|uniref:O-antigen ligase family protein n=1 Tax=Leptospira ognonensis TaxID=2484945 RepID=A0A4R9JYD9_9LEPT|nr:O-antigen ligase family protein [Leptospira ognonensis]TGL57215.1 O-antigen ligase family protein [Leptospira ognonensis]
MYIFGIAFLAYILGLFYFSPIRFQTITDLSVLLILGFSIAYYKKKLRSLTQKHWLFILSANLLLLYIFSYNLDMVPETSIPRYKLYFKVSYFALILLLNFHLFRVRNLSFLFLLVTLCVTNISISWYFLGFTIKNIPLLMFALCYLPLVFRSKKLVNDAIDKILLAIVIYLLCILPLSYDYFNSVLSTSYFTLSIIVFFIARSLPSRIYQKILLKQLLSVFFITNLFIFSAKINYLLVDKALLGLKVNFGGFNTNSLGGMYCLYFIILVFNRSLFKDKIPSLFYFGSLVSASFLFVSFHNRSSYIGVTIAFSIFLLVNNQLRISEYFGKIKKLYLVGILCLFILCSFFALFYIYNHSNFDSFKIRLSIWDFYLKEIFLYSPWFGFGIDAPYIHAAIDTERLLDSNTASEYLGFIHTFGPNIHSHNVFIQVLFSLGIIGLGLCLTFLTLSIIHLIKNETKRSSFYFIFGMALISLFVHELFDYTLADPATFFPAMVLLGFLLQTKRQSKTKVHKDVYLNLILSILVLVIFIISWQYIIMFKKMESIKHLVKTDLVGNAFIPAGMKASSDKFERYEELRKYLMFDSWNYKSIAMDGEVYFSKYHSDLEPENNLEASKRKYLECIHSNFYQAFCYFRLMQISSIKNDKVEEENYRLKLILMDRYQLIKEETYR